jgi:hypothetical protein
MFMFVYSISIFCCSSYVGGGDALLTSGGVIQQVCASYNSKENRIGTNDRICSTLIKVKNHTMDTRVSY